jgi:MFS family permease
MAWIPTYLQRDFGLKVAQAASLSGVVLAGGSLTGTLLGGWLADFLQRRRPQGRMIVTTIAFLAGAPLTLLALMMHSLPYFIMAFVPAIIALSLCLGPIQAIIQDVTTPDIRSTAVGLALLLGHLLGDALSPVIIGAISQRSSLGFALLITAPTCLLLAGLICLLGLKTVAKDMEAMREQIRKQRKQSHEE